MVKPKSKMARRPGRSAGVNPHRSQIARQLSNILRSIMAPNARESSLAAIPERSSSNRLTSSLSMAADISRKFMNRFGQTVFPQGKKARNKLPDPALPVEETGDVTHRVRMQPLGNSTPVSLAPGL
jgi:hypothetical protein